MANALYDKGREKFLTGAINASADTLKCALIKDTYAPTLWPLMATLSMGAPRMIDEATAARCNADSLTFNDDHGGPRDVFDHLVRRVNRIDSSYLDL